MTRIRRIGLLTAAAVAAVAAVAVTGCGSNDNTAPTTIKPASAGTGTVRVADSALGKILVDAQGKTLYLFEQDTGTKSTCSGGCATAWPPLRANAKPTAGDGAQASLLATTARSDGKPQVTYNGHPLYYYQGDSNAGDTNGQAVDAFGAPWYVLSPSGDAITTAASNSSGGSGY